MAQSKAHHDDGYDGHQQRLGARVVRVTDERSTCFIGFHQVDSAYLDWERPLGLYASGDGLTEWADVSSARSGVKSLSSRGQPWAALKAHDFYSLRFFIWKAAVQVVLRIGCPVCASRATMLTSAASKLSVRHFRSAARKSVARKLKVGELVALSAEFPQSRLTPLAATSLRKYG